MPHDESFHHPDFIQPLCFFNLEVTITTKGFLNLEVSITNKGNLKFRSNDNN